MRILLLHPGDMGSAIGACFREAGHEVIWVSDGRSPVTRRRAEAVDLTEVASLESAVQDAELVFSVCPPHAALDLATEVTNAGPTGLYVDANAISPTRSREIHDLVEDGGGTYVDGGIIGGPPRQPGTTRLYLAGEHARRVSDVLAGTNLDTRIVNGPPGSASALKMVYAAWSKGTTGMLEAILAVARVEGVEDDLRAEWEISLPGLSRRADRAAGSARKAWRWIGEMEEIADTFTEAGMPDGFHRAAAEVFRHLTDFKDATDVTIEEVINRLASVVEGETFRR